MQQRSRITLGKKTFNRDHIEPNSSIKLVMKKENKTQTGTSQAQNPELFANNHIYNFSMLSNVPQIQQMLSFLCSCFSRPRMDR